MIGSWGRFRLQLPSARFFQPGGVPKWSKGTVCKTVIRRFKSGRHLQPSGRRGVAHGPSNRRRAAIRNLPKTVIRFANFRYRVQVPERREFGKDIGSAHRHAETRTPVSQRTRRIRRSRGRSQASISRTTSSHVRYFGRSLRATAAIERGTTARVLDDSRDRCKGIGARRRFPPLESARISGRRGPGLNDVPLL